MPALNEADRATIRNAAVAAALAAALDCLDATPRDPLDRALARLRRAGR